MKRKISRSGSLKRLDQTECMAYTFAGLFTQSFACLLACPSDDSENNVFLSDGR